MIFSSAGEMCLNWSRCGVGTKGANAYRTPGTSSSFTSSLFSSTSSSSFVSGVGTKGPNAYETSRTSSSSTSSSWSSSTSSSSNARVVLT